MHWKETAGVASVTGVNITPGQAAAATELARGRPGLSFVLGDACALPFADAGFSRVVSLEAAQHFPDRTRFLAEAHSLLRPGGILVTTDPAAAPRPAAPPLRRLRQETIRRAERLDPMDYCLCVVRK